MYSWFKTRHQNWQVYFDSLFSNQIIGQAVDWT